MDVHTFCRLFLICTLIKNVKTVASPCDSGLCFNNGICSDSPASYSCECNTGYGGVRCENVEPPVGYFSCENPDGNPNTNDEIVTFAMNTTQSGGVSWNRIFPVQAAHLTDGTGCNSTNADASGELSLVLATVSGFPSGGCTLMRDPDNTVSVEIIATKSLLKIESDDYKFTYLCNFSNPTTQQATLPAATISGSLVTIAPNVREEKVSLNVLKEDTFDNYVDSAGSITLGQLIKLELSLTKSGTAKKTSGVSCTASNADGSNQLALITNRCVTAESGIELNTGFGVDVTNGATVFKTSTGPFKSFIFSNGNEQIAFSCEVAFCNGNGALTPCDVDNCKGLVRRRRDAEEDNEKTEHVSVVVSIEEPKTLKNEAASSDHNENSHETFASFYTIIAILSVLLLLVIVVVTVFGIRSSRSANTRPSKVSNDSSSSALDRVAT